jgi:hypothetical protein
MRHELKHILRHNLDNALYSNLPAEGELASIMRQPSIMLCLIKFLRHETNIDRRFYRQVHPRQGDLHMDAIIVRPTSLPHIVCIRSMRHVPGDGSSLLCHAPPVFPAALVISHSTILNYCQGHGVSLKRLKTEAPAFNIPNTLRIRGFLPRLSPSRPTSFASATQLTRVNPTHDFLPRREGITITRCYHSCKCNFMSRACAKTSRVPQDLHDRDY